MAEDCDIIIVIVIIFIVIDIIKITVLAVIPAEGRCLD